MVKEKRILSYFLGWLIVGFLICFVGISNVSAEEVAYSNATFRVKECGSDEWSSWTSASQKLSVYSVNNLGLRLYFNNTTLTGNVYYNITVTYNYYQESPSLNVLNDYTKASFYYNTTASESGNIQGSINNYSVRFEKDSDNANVIIATYNVLVPVDSKFLAFNINWNNANENTCRTLSEGFTISNIKVESLNDTNAIIDSNNANADNIINNNNSNTQDIINNQNQNNEELKDTIKDQFNDCRDSVNLIDKNLFKLETVYYYYMYLENPQELYTLSIKLKENGISKKIYIGISENNIPTLTNFSWLMSDGTIYGINTNDGFRYINNFQNNIYRKYVVIYLNGYTLDDLFDNYYIQLQKGNFSGYEPYGEEICTNKLDEQVETSKGIWETIKNLPNAFMDMLKGLFIPEDGYFEDWFNDLKLFFEEKLGFLATPFTIVIDFINRYLSLNPNDDIVINIPDITVPNFEDYKIVQATTFNWSELLNSKESLKTLWELYLSFVDVFLILNFIGLCETKYNRIFGGDTTPYEYYTTEDSYMFDTDTGEITKMGVHKEKRTTRKKVV